jgi:multicomponent Na+:H+ antiporter subunit F
MTGVTAVVAESQPAFLETAVFVGLVVAAAVTLVAGYRVIRGPTTPDRVVGLDTIGTNVVAIATLFAIQSDAGLFVDVALVLAIIGFISTIAVARYVTDGDIIE